MGLLLLLMFGWIYLLVRIGFSILRFFGGFLGLILILLIFAKVVILGLWLAVAAFLGFVGWLVYRTISGRV
ncbi:hypothetical protein ACFQ22_02475 [Lentilactobacillus raoultii]|uniref:Uncharacterized protein n=1 Tax=Lentilactobacillus raoultii TaxID=1987503 RepID=A0ABW3PPH8_9LACO|nr:hypothetical protein [Lentilactobacillus raoultii]